MKLLGILLVALVVLASAQAAMAVLCVLLLVGVIWALLTCPKELFGLVGLLAMVGVFQAQPLACLGILALLIIAKICKKVS
jgi:hypothetical protein